MPYEHLLPDSELMKAVRDNDINKVRKLAKKEDVNYSNSENETPITYACKYNNLDALIILIEAGANITVEAGNIAALHGNTNVVKYLVDGHLVQSAVLMEIAVKCGCMDIVEFMVSRFNINELDLEKALLAACKYGQADLATYLLTFPLQVDVPDLYGHTPLFFAVSKNMLSVVKLLYVAGANMHFENINKDTPFILALKKKGEIIDFFMDVQ